jgi:hypothetical protein
MGEVQRREGFVETARQRAGGALGVQTHAGIAHHMRDCERK